MSGHSKWATIKHKKGAADARRGKLFAKLIRQVEVAAREGGGDPDMNPTLRTMYQKARDSSVPLDTIERAIKRGTGDLEGDPFRAVFIRAPFVERAGPDVEVLATVDGHPVLCRQGRVTVAAFHPELSHDLRLHDHFLKGI